MARPARPEQSRSARSSRQFSRFYYSINPDQVFGTHRNHLVTSDPRRTSPPLRPGLGFRYTQATSLFQKGPFALSGDGKGPVPVHSIFQIRTERFILGVLGPLAFGDPISESQATDRSTFCPMPGGRAQTASDAAA